MTHLAVAGGATSSVLDRPAIELFSLRCGVSRNRESTGPLRMLTAVEQAADGIVVTDTQGKIQFVNPAFTAMTGYSSLESVGQSPRILKSGLQRLAFYENLWFTIRSGRVWEGTCQLSSVNVLGSLVELQLHVREPAACLAEWMPWNYRKTLSLTVNLLDPG